MKENRFNRKEIVNNSIIINDRDQNKLKIRIAQWNIFAQGFVEADNFQYAKPNELILEKRIPLFAKELSFINADIYCLQEADIHGELLHILNQTTVKYQDVFVCKTNSPCLLYSKNVGPDGLAIIFNIEKFNVIDSDLIRLDKTANYISFMLAFELKEAPKHRFIVINTHLKSKKVFRELRVNQIEMIMNTLKNFSEKLHINDVIFCGDFNATPDEPVFEKVREYDFINVYDKFHEEIEPINDFYTTWTFRKEESQTKRQVSSGRAQNYVKSEETEKSDIIDYIFYRHKPNCNLKPASIIDVPDKSHFNGKGLPYPSLFPSDHVSLIADFVFL